MQITIQEIKERALRLFLAAGVSEEDAAIITDVLLTTEMRGVFTHGFFRLPRYIHCLETGGMKKVSELNLLADLPSWAVADGGYGLGIVLSVKAMRLAIEKAKKTGVGVVNVCASHHFGAAGYYAEMAAKEGMVGMAMSNGNPLVAATGTAARTIGNNPFSYAVPAGKYGNLVYDIAMSATSDIKVLELAKEGKLCPAGWLLDKDGVPTENPNDYIEGGILLPFGGYKGYGLAMMVEVMGAVLSGADITQETNAWNDDPNSTASVGHMFMALDIEKIQSTERFTTRMEELLDGIKGAKRAAMVEKVYFPGEIEEGRRLAAEAAGVLNIKDDTMAAIREVEARYGF